MHIARQKMAAETELPVVKPFEMADEFWCSFLKILDASGYQETVNCLNGTLLGWLGPPKFQIFFVAPSELCISYFTFFFSKCLLRFSASIFIKFCRFPYQDENVNEWFTLSNEDVERDQAVNIINVDRDGQARKCYTTQNQNNNFPESLEDDEFEIFFHGTRHKSAQDIMESGIDVEVKEEKKPLDFSHAGDGFYLSTSFDEAWEWAKKNHPSPAVLVFRVKKTELRGENGLVSLDLRGPEKKKEWQEVISQFRSGEPDRNFLKRHRKYQFIEGPMASFPRKNPRSEHPKRKDGKKQLQRLEHPKQKESSSEGSYQLCVKKDNCAELFDRNLHSVVFFDK